MSLGGEKRVKDNIVHITGKKVAITAIIIVAFTILFFWAGGGILIMLVDMKLAHNKDVTQKEQYWGEYKYGQEFELTIDVFLEQVDDWSERLVLTPEGQLHQHAGLYSAPNSVAEYHENPEVWPDIVDVLNSGTQIKCKMVRKHGTMLWGSSITTFAEILDGPHKGKIVDIDDISELSSKKYRGIIFREPDPRILKEIVTTEE
jgi:hypothetical protein